MWYFTTLSDMGIFSFYKASDLSLLLHNRTGSQEGIRADVNAFPGLDLLKNAKPHYRGITYLRVSELTIRSNLTTNSDLRLPLEKCPWIDNRIASDLHLKFDISGGRINDGHAFRHQVLQDPAPHNSIGFR